MATRIVALSPSSAEAAFALGLQDEVVGVGEACTGLPGAAGKPTVAGVTTFDAAAVLDLKPQLVLAYAVPSAAGRAAGTAWVAEVRAAGVEVDVASPEDTGGVLHELLRLGLRTGRVAEASAAIDATRGRLEAVLARVPPDVAVACYLEAWPDPPTTVAAGHWLHDVLQLCGGRNVFEPSGAPALAASLDEVATRAPQAMLGVWPASSAAGPARPARFALRPGWDALSAVGEGRAHVLPDPLLAWPGPRVDALAAWMVGALHAPA